jgi:4-hydroxybenzoate polyprenyltransferase
MMKNVLWYLGFMALLSLLYFVNSDPGYLLYISFAMFFFTYNAKDERVEVNEGKASRNAFLYMMITAALSLAYVSLTGTIEFYQWAFALVIAGALVVCVLSFKYYETTGD